MNLFLIEDPTVKINNALFFAGKLLLLCQEFEFSCKHVYAQLKMKKCLDSLSDNQVFTIEKFVETISQMKTKKMLGGLHKDNEKNFTNLINEKYFDDIKNAIKVRNHICHDLFKDLTSYAGGYSSVRDVHQYNLRDEFLSLRGVEGLPSDESALNIFMVGSYSVMTLEHMFEHKEPFFLSEEDYKKKLMGFLS